MAGFGTNGLDRARFAHRGEADSKVGGAVLYATGIIGSKNSVTIQLPKVK